MKVFIDFDDVIFNTKKFKRDLIRVFLRNGVTRQEFDNSYYTFQKRAQEWGQYYDPKKQIKVLKKKFYIDQKKLEKDIDELMSDLSAYVFPDVYNFISYFPKRDLFLITYGHVRHQLKKIRRCGINKCFREILIAKRNKIDVIIETCKEHNFKEKEEIIFIDDRPEQLERAEGIKRNITTFRICRPEGRYSDLLCLDKDYEVKNLKQALRILKEK